MTMDYDEFASYYFNWIHAVISVPIYWIYLFINDKRRK